MDLLQDRPKNRSKDQQHGKLEQMENMFFSLSHSFFFKKSIYFSCAHSVAFVSGAEKEEDKSTSVFLKKINISESYVGNSIDIQSR